MSLKGNMKKKFLLSITLVILLSCTKVGLLEATERNFVHSTLTFNTLKIGDNLTRSKLNEVGIKTGDVHNGLDERTKIIQDAVSGDNLLQIYSPKGGYGSKQTGAQVELKLDPSNQYYMEYTFKFSEDFSWGDQQRGGKLPGLTGGERCNPDFNCTGENGFAARFMWRYDGQGELYLYHMNKPGKYGESIPFIYPDGKRVKFEKGREYHIKEYVQLNSSPNAQDGQVIVWLDNQMVAKKEQIQFVTDDQQIDTLFLSTFHGGHDSSWAPQNDSYLYIDDLKVSK